MITKELKTVIWDENGYKETIIETIEVEETPIEDVIAQKEEELIRIYNEIQVLKAKQ